MHNPPHPGLVLREYLLGKHVRATAAQLCITRATLSRVLEGKADISPRMAQRLAAVLGTSSELWMNLQSQYDLWHGDNGETVS
jgi:addiction module HigA family antidote